MKTAAAINPHDLFGALHPRQRAFTHIFGTRESWAEYWGCVQNEPWFIAHPAREHILREPWCHCPYLVFGDDAQTSKRVGNNVKILVWYSTMSIERKTELRLLPIYMTPTTEKNRAAVERRLSQQAVWSFTAASRNIHPSSPAAEDEGPLSKGRLAKSGKPICGGDIPTYLTFSGAAGDWKWQKEECPLE